MCKAVFLDVDNTLLDFNACATLSLRRAFARVGVARDAAEAFPVFRRVNDALWLSLERGEITREQLHAVRFTRVFEALGVEADAAAAEQTFFTGLHDTAEPVDGARELLAYLHGKYRVYVASNSSYDQQHRRLGLAGMLPDIDALFVSASLGANKPSRAFFDACFAQLPGLAPGECVMIGDSLSADIAGAADYGMRTVWFNHDHVPVPSPCPADHVVDRLAEIRDIL